MKIDVVEANEYDCPKCKTSIIYCKCPPRDYYTARWDISTIPDPSLIEEMKRRWPDLLSEDDYELLGALGPGQLAVKLWDETWQLDTIPDEKFIEEMKRRKCLRPENHS